MPLHLTKVALKRLFSGRAFHAEVDSMASHIAACRPCRDLAARVVAELRKEDALARSTDVRAAILAMLDVEARANRELLRARAWWTELKDLPREEQMKRIASVAALRTQTLFEVILADARSVASGDPLVGEETALLAHGVAESLPDSRCPEDLKNDLRAEAMIVLANCRRLAALWPSSRAALAAARNLLDRGTGDPARRARLFSIWASLESDTGNSETALGLLRRAADLYRSAPEPAGLATVAVQEASTLLAASRHEEAAARAGEVLAVLFPGELRLTMLARSIVTESLIYLDRPEEALQSFMATRPLYEQLRSRSIELRAAYLEALLLDSLGCIRESEKTFREIVDGFIEEDLFKDAFVVLLTLLETFTKRRAFRKAKQVYQQATDLLAQAGSGSHEQMRQVWSQLLLPIEAESLKEYQIQDIRQYVVRHWNVPARRPPALEYPS